VASRGLLSVVPLFALAGAGDLGGNAFFLLANQHDALAVAVVLSSLYPVMTTLLATVFLGERLRLVQWTGVALAVIGVALIGVGGAAA
ncbi:MAG: EamA family transporter, partial [Chloroflexota bacterium]|nr:EamA family transporter [Chloroflexota bacterium]